MKISIGGLLFVSAGLFFLIEPVSAQDIPEILAIRTLYGETKALVASELMYKQEIDATLLVIPGIGSPVQRAVFYHTETERNFCTTLRAISFFITPGRAPGISTNRRKFRGLEKSGIIS